jgi:hypothetical protein
MTTFTGRAGDGLRVLRRVGLAAGVAAAAVASFGAGQAVAAAPVPCHSIGAGKYECNFYVPGDGHAGGAPVKDGGGGRVGFLHKGRNWVLCQQVGGRETSGAYFNDNWAWTLADNNRAGWINAVYASGGDNDGAFGGVPACNGAHGNAPGGAPAPAPGPQPGPAPAPGENANGRRVVNWAVNHVSWWAGKYSMDRRLPVNQSVDFMKTHAPPRGGRQACDCSSFVRWAMAQADVNAGSYTKDMWTAYGKMPARYSSAQTNTQYGLVLRGQGTNPPGGFRVGDLIFYGVSGMGTGTGHVALYMGNGKIVQCSGSRGSNAGMSMDYVHRTGWIRYQRVSG